MSSPVPVRFVHLSDLHLTARDGASRSEPRLFGRLEGMNATFRAITQQPLVRDADYVLATGDITDRGELGAWKVFWRAIDDAGLTSRTLVVPGNHDLCHLGAPRVGKHRTLRTADVHRATTGLGLGLRRALTTYPWVKIIEKGRIAIIGIDSNNAGNTSAADNAIGRIGTVQTRKLVRLLRRPDVAGCAAKILLMHHSPNIPRTRPGAEHYGPLSRWGHEVPEVDRVSLRHLCALGGVRLIAHGHLHRSDDRQLDGVRLIGAPATTQPKPRTKHTYQAWSYTVHGSSGRIRAELADVSLR